MTLEAAILLTTFVAWAIGVLIWDARVRDNSYDRSFRFEALAWPIWLFFSFFVVFIAAIAFGIPKIVTRVRTRFARENGSIE